MCDHSPNREAAMVIIDPGTHERHGRDGVWCDPCLVPLVRALNEGGHPTVASCCGHGHRPGRVDLVDGRALFVLPDFESASELDDLIHEHVGCKPGRECTASQPTSGCSEPLCMLPEHGDSTVHRADGWGWG